MRHSLKERFSNVIKGMIAQGSSTPHALSSFLPSIQLTPHNPQAVIIAVSIVSPTLLNDNDYQ